MSDIESFIRSQKEKLYREKSITSQNGSYENSYKQQQDQIVLEHKRQLEKYLNLPVNNNQISLKEINPQVQQFTSPILQNNRQVISEQYQNQNFEPQMPRQNVDNKENKREEFFDNFGKYEVKKDKLKNDLHQEYNDYLQKKNTGKRNDRNNPAVSEKYYATLPLQTMDSAYKNKNSINGANNQVIKNSKNFENKKWDRWTKNKSEPDIKPYSLNQNGSNRNINDIFNNNSNTHFPQLDDRSNSNDKIQYNKFANQFDSNNRSLSQNGLENYYENSDLAYDAYRVSNSELNSKQIYPSLVQNYSTPPAAIDPSLSAILSRPPVGYKPPPRVQPVYQYPPDYNQHNDSRFHRDDFKNNQNIQNDYNNIPNSNYRSDSPPYHLSNQNFTNNNSAVNPNLSRNEGPFNFTDNNSNLSVKAQKAKEYQNELNKQILEKKIQKQREKEAQNLYDEKKRVENLTYDPYGKGGGGAPIKDSSGNIIANLDKVKATGTGQNFTPRIPEVSLKPQTFEPNGYQSQVRYSDGIGTGSIDFPTSRLKEEGHARGGNGLFGEAKTDTQKKTANNYKEELQQQIEQKRKKKEEEKERERLEDEKEYNRIMAQQLRIKQELEEEERKKKDKEEKERLINKEEGKRVANKKNNVDVKISPRKPQASKFQRNNLKEDNQTPLPPQIQPEFRTNSPPVPAIGKKLTSDETSNTVKSVKNVKETTTDYYVTESNLNLSSPPRTPLVSEYPNDSHKSTNRKQNFKNDRKFQNNDKTTDLSREASKMSNNEVLAQLKNLKKHLHKEQIQVENDLNNSNNRTNIGQLSDIRQRILNVETPTGDKGVFYSALNKEPTLVRRNPTDFQKTYRKELDTPPLNGGLEKGTYFRDNTVLLDNQVYSQNDNYLDISNRHQINKVNKINTKLDDDLNLHYDTQLLSARNQQRLRKLRDLEDDNLSNADPNEVLDKFLNKNNRQPSARTVNDDTWLRQPE